MSTLCSSALNSYRKRSTPAVRQWLILLYVWVNAPHYRLTPHCHGIGRKRLITVCKSFHNVLASLQTASETDTLLRECSPIWPLTRPQLPPSDRWTSPCTTCCLEAWVDRRHAPCPPYYRPRFFQSARSCLLLSRTPHALILSRRTARVRSSVLMKWTTMWSNRLGICSRRRAGSVEEDDMPPGNNGEVTRTGLQDKAHV